MTKVGPCASCSLAIQRPARLCAACSEPWACWLPFPPSVNNLFSQGTVRGKTRRFPSKRYKAWRTQAVTLLRASWRSRPAWPVPVVIQLELMPPDARARDASNYIKAVEDALVEARVLVDDSNKHVKAVTPMWEEGDEAGVLVTIRPVEEKPVSTAATKPKKEKPLTEAQQRLLAAYRREGMRLYAPSHKPSRSLQILVERGLLKKIPGLLDETPQGYAPAE